MTDRWLRQWLQTENDRWNAILEMCKIKVLMHFYNIIFFVAEISKIQPIEFRFNPMKSNFYLNDTIDGFIINKKSHSCEK